VCQESNKIDFNAAMQANQAGLLNQVQGTSSDDIKVV
jgi:hypothetical protein